MDAKNHVDITADPAGNLLKLSFRGKINAAEMEPYVTDVETAVQNLPRGFFLLTDLSDLQSMDLSCVPYIRRTMDLIRDHGVRRIVRIIPDPAKDIGFNIMSLFHYSRDVQTVTCENQTEAERALAD